MNFDLADLRAFVSVADLNSFRAAAEAIHLSQPALSRRIEKLESALGVRLFDRTTRKVSLTAVGRDFVRKARALLDDLESSLLGIRDLATRQSGEVTVACIPSAVYYFLPRVLSRYHARYPNIRIRIIDEGANEVLSSVVRGEADFGINFIGSQEPEIDFHAILREPFVAALRRDHPLARKRRITWKEFGQYDFMAVGKSSGNRLLMDLGLVETPARPRWFYEVRHVSTLVGLVEAGLGVAAVPRLAMPAPDHPVLASVPLVEPTITRTVGLIRRRGRSLSPAAEELRGMLQEVSTQRRRRRA